MSNSTISQLENVKIKLITLLQDVNGIWSQFKDLSDYLQQDTFSNSVNSLICTNCHFLELVNRLFLFATFSQPLNRWELFVPTFNLGTIICLSFRIFFNHLTIANLARFFLAALWILIIEVDWCFTFTIDFFDKVGFINRTDTLLE